jgi:hypothetical protein
MLLECVVTCIVIGSESSEEVRVRHDELILWVLHTGECFKDLLRGTEESDFIFVSASDSVLSWSFSTEYHWFSKEEMLLMLILGCHHMNGEG